MRVCLFEDRFVAGFEPLTLTRPIFSLRCGMVDLAEKQRRHFAACELGALLRPYLAACCQADFPFLRVNDPGWLHAASTILVNGRWLPPVEAASVSLSPHVGLLAGEVAYAVLPPHLLTYCSPNTVDDCLEIWKQTLPCVAVGGRMIHRPWDLLHQFGGEIRKDLAWRAMPMERGFHPSFLTLVGPSEELFVHDTAEIEPWVVADTTHGPVVVDREAKVEAYSRLEGPCYVGPRSVIQAAKVRSSMIGPACRVGGEVSHGILHSFVVKEHEGYLGHSCLGAWTHLSAGVETCDRRLDYQPLSVPAGGERIETGCRRLGMVMGDHSQIGIRGIVNAGSIIGVFCDLLPQGEMYPRQVPSFCQVNQGRLQPQGDLMGRFQTAAELMALAGWALPPEQEQMFRHVHQLTATQRRQLTRNWGEEYLRRAA